MRFRCQNNRIPKIFYCLGGSQGLNYENIGGTPVLGVNAPIVIGHGKSSAQAIKSMILATEHAVRANIVEQIKEAFK